MAKESELSSLQKTWEGFKAQDEQKNDLVQVTSLHVKRTTRRHGPALLTFGRVPVLIQ